MFTRIMLNQIHLAALLFICSATPRSPRIYNVLISSKKNLSPSHALPIYEPVLRTTSLGYIFPSLIYQSPIISPVQIAQYEYNQFPKGSAGEIAEGGAIMGGVGGRNTEASINAIKKMIPNITEPDKETEENKELNYKNSLPYYNPVPLNYDLYPTHTENQQIVSSYPKTKPEPTDPKQIVANLKRNPEIPDIPPLPLPVRVS